jgi:hypothetical protein
LAKEIVEPTSSVPSGGVRDLDFESIARVSGYGVGVGGVSFHKIYLSFFDVYIIPYFYLFVNKFCEIYFVNKQ